MTLTGYIIAKADGVVAGMSIAAAVFKLVDTKIALRLQVSEGQKVMKGQTLANVEGSGPALIQGDMQTIRNLMWHYAGLVRSEHRLNRAIRKLCHLWLEIEDFYRKTRLSDGLIGLRNSIQAALLVPYAAHRNTTSRGCHFREGDFPRGIPLPNGNYPPELNDG